MKLEPVTKKNILPNPLAEDLLLFTDKFITHTHFCFSPLNFHFRFV